MKVRTTRVPQILLFAALAVFLFWRAQYGYSFNDEPFCVTLAQRLFQGDTLFRDEWHVCQNFGVVLLPLYALYHTIFGGTTGILLAFRLVYSALWLGCMAVLFYTIYPRQKLAAYVAAVYMGLFSPLDYMTLSYTSLSLMCVVLLMCLFAGRPLAKMQLRHGVVCGVLVAVLALCNPYMAVPCVVLWLVGLGCSFGKKWTIDRRFLWGGVLGVLLLFVPYLVLIFSRADLAAILKNLPALLGDPEHKEKTLWAVVKEIFAVIKVLSPRMCKLALPTLVAAIALYLLPRKLGDGFRLVFWCYAVVRFCQTTAEMVPLTREYLFNCQIKDLPLLGLIAFLLLRKKDWKLFAIFYGFGAVYTVLACFASNTGSAAQYMGLSTCGIGGLVFAVALTKELCAAALPLPKVTGGVAAAALAAVCLFQLGGEGYIRLYRTYWDDKPVTALHTRITAGPAKGLVTSAEKAAAYEADARILDDLFAGEDTDGKTFLSYTSCPWYYLYVDMRYDTYSAWTFGSEEILPQRLQQYYTLNDRAYPDYIYIREGVTDIPQETQKLYEVKTTSYGDAVLLCKRG